MYELLFPERCRVFVLWEVGSIPIRSSVVDSARDLPERLSVCGGLTNLFSKSFALIITRCSMSLIHKLVRSFALVMLFHVRNSFGKSITRY